MNTKPISFIDIFSASDSIVKSIEIPIIQRDYAQGRENKEVNRIRENFLNVLNDALTGKSEPVKLDFVYGNIINGKLIPLDGQQRLTTLFLLHWYVATHEGIPEKDYTFLNSFTYKIRFTSQHFCDGLMKCVPDFSSETLSKWIVDQSWFMYSWSKDPTIQSMLVVLDGIHKLLKDKFSLWERLSDTSSPAISFYFLPLEDMGLTDSLYIKMNSRGKPLTEFEHFKAEFEKIVKEVSPDLLNEFVHKADVDWLDMLWKYRANDDDIDAEFMKYFRFVTEMICYSNSIEILENDFELANRVYGKKNPAAIENLKFLFSAFDCWRDSDNIDNFFGKTFSKTTFEKNKVRLFTEDLNLFKECCRNYSSLAIDEKPNFTLNNILLLFAVTTYLINMDIVSEEQFTERIRMVRNLVFNSPDEIRRERLSALLSDVLGILLEGKVNTGTIGFNEIQKNEENEKINWRYVNTELIDDLYELEDHILLRGSVAIIGLTEAEKIKSRVINFRKLFDGAISLHIISRALLTIGDYSQLASWRFIFGNDNNSTWRELFTMSKQRKNFENTRSTLLKLLDAVHNGFQDYLNELISAYLNNPSTIKDWRFYFVKYPAMRSGKSGVYWWKNDSTREKKNQYEIIMMNTAVKTSGKHWDPFLFCLANKTDLKLLLSLEEYDAPLIINKTGERIRCKNETWEFFDSGDVLVKSVTIPQNNGVDLVDRIEFFLQHLKQRI